MSTPPVVYSPWQEMMDELNVASRDAFGYPTQYQRMGFPAFPIVGIPKFLDRLEDVNRGQFYSVFYRTKDFEAATFRASVTAQLTGVPNNGDTITFAGITYICARALDNTVPYQFLRGATAADTAINLASVINAAPELAGIFFSSSTMPHPLVTAIGNDLGLGKASVIVSAIIPGVDGDSLTASDDLTSCTLSAGLFSGGGPLENDLITLQGVLYRASDVPEHDPEGGVQIRLEKKAL